MGGLHIEKAGLVCLGQLLSVLFWYREDSFFIAFRYRWIDDGSMQCKQYQESEVYASSYHSCVSEGI